MSCLLGVSHVLGGLGGRSAALKWQHRRRQERPSVGAASWLPASLHAAIATPCAVLDACCVWYCMAGSSGCRSSAGHRA